MPSAKTTSGRARPLPVEERREALIDATTRALREQRRPLSTREIALAAGVAEGTIFRIFASKDDLIDAVIAKAFLPWTLHVELGDIDLDQPLRSRLIDCVQVLQTRFQNVFGLMQALGMTAPPNGLHTPDEDAARHAELLTWARDHLVGDDADRLRVSVADLLRYLRLLTFSGSHEQISDGQPLSPSEIVDVILAGVLECSGSAEKMLTSTGAAEVTS